MAVAKAICATAGVLALTALATWASAQAAAPTGDPARGKTVFGQCLGCHVLTGPSFTAPPLAGVFGRKAGTAKGFDYSKPLIASGIVWNDQTLDRFLADPSGLVPGTAMFTNLGDAQDRADVIAYIKAVPPRGAP